MSHIYVLTAPCRKGQFKIGIHTGSYADLVHRYATYLYDPQVLLLAAIDDAKHKESQIHHELEKYVILHKHSGRKSEWFKCSYQKVSQAVEKICKVEMPVRNQGCLCM